MIFPVIETEAIVQVGDKTRLNATKTYGAKGAAAIAKVEIEPEAGAGFVNVTDVKPSNWFTDWQYVTSGTKTITLQINGDTTPVTITSTISIVTEAADMLFAADSDLIMEEPDILRWLKAGRSSFKDVHREVQTQIVDMLNRKGYRTTDGSPITKQEIVDHSQIREIAKYWALMIIFNAQSNQVGDVFSAKAQEYNSKLNTVLQRQILGLDLNRDGNIESGEGVNIHSSTLLRR
jgi:hypothetical protein